MAVSMTKILVPQNEYRENANKLWSLVIFMLKQSWSQEMELWLLSHHCQMYKLTKPEVK